MPPNVGETAPLFTLPTQRGVPVSLSDILQRGAALLAFPGRIRIAGAVAGSGARAAADRRLLALAHLHARIRDAGLQLLVIVPNRQEAAKRYVEEVGTPFHLLCDERGEVATRYGVRRLALLFASTSPALFGIDAAGLIRYRLLGDWNDPSPFLSDTLAALSLPHLPSLDSRLPANVEKTKRRDDS